MKQIFITLAAVFFGGIAVSQTPLNFYDFEVTDIDGHTFAFSQLDGKKVMIVNVASKCGYTKH